jgi:hypothetical protein
MENGCNCKLYISTWSSARENKIRFKTMDMTFLRHTERKQDRKGTEMEFLWKKLKYNIWQHVCLRIQTQNKGTYEMLQN